MKYLCLCDHETARFESLGQGEMEALGRACKSWDQVLGDAGKLFLHGSLADPAQPRVVRPRGGKPSVMHGPCVDAPEPAGGFFIIEADDMDAAMAPGSKHAAAHLPEVEQTLGRGIEIRPCDWLELT